MNNKNDSSYWDDIIGCLLVIILMCIDYDILIEDGGGGTRGEWLVNIFIILNMYLGKVGVYLCLAGLFLFFLTNAIRNILKNNKNE